MYGPPGGAVGAGLDRAILHRVALATIRSFLHRTAVAITNPAPAHETAGRAIAWRGDPAPESLEQLLRKRVVPVESAEWWAEFKIFQEGDGRYSWQLQAASGRIIARSGHCYNSKYWCEQDVDWLRANAHQIMVYDRTREPCLLPA